MDFYKLLLALISFTMAILHFSGGNELALNGKNQNQILSNGLVGTHKHPLVDPSRICRRNNRKYRSDSDTSNLITHGRIPQGQGLSRFRRKVTNLCKKAPELIRESTRGAHLATNECQRVLKNSHWNCTALPRVVRKILTKDTRETAIVHAFVSAGVTYAITQACSSGQIQDCPCDRTYSGRSTEGNFEWGGCNGNGDNIHIGYARGKDILDIKGRRRSDIRSLMLLHNNEAGRLAVKSHMNLMCKCHGLSGSCTIKTCWYKLSPLAEIGERLKVRFDGAVKVILGNDGRSVIPSVNTVKPPENEDLIYFDDSQDFCKANKQLGSLGTHGRECNATSMGTDGCDLLCCGRGYNTKTVKIKEYCRCRFMWCCEVKCDICSIKKVIHTCR